MKFNKILIVVLLSISSFTFAQENTENLDNTTNQTNKTENKDPRQDTVAFGLTTSLVGAGYFSGKGGLLSQTSLEIFAGHKGYLYNIIQMITPIIEPLPKNVFSGTFLNVGIGYGNWVYKNLDSTQKGWLIGLNIALLSGAYNQYVKDQDKGSLNGWIFGLGVLGNMRAIYQLNRNFGFIMGVDLSYYYPFSFTTGFDTVQGLTGGITVGIAF